MRPYLGNVGNIPFIGLGILLWHDLNVEGPSSWFAISDVVVKVFGVVILGPCFNLFYLVKTQSFNSYIWFYMVLNKESISLFINPSESMSTEAIHVSISVSDTSFWEEEHDVHHALWSKTDEVPLHIWASHASLRMSLSRVDYIRELYRIPNEEEWSIVAYHVQVTFFGIELDSESSGVSVGIRETLFT